MPKDVIATIRLSAKEAKAMKEYLRQNPCLDSFSSLGRVALMEFIRTRTSMPLHPLCERTGQGRPAFLWDYDLTEAQAHEILRHEPLEQRKWLIARILERAPLEEVRHYLTLEQIRQALPALRMDPKVSRHWQEAVELWTSPRSNS